MLHIHDFLSNQINEAYTERADIDDYSSIEKINDTIQNKIDSIENFSNTERLKVYCNVIAVILYHTLQKTKGTVFLSFNPDEKKDSKYPKINRSSINLINKALDNKTIKDVILKDINELGLLDGTITDVTISGSKDSTKLNVKSGKDVTIIGLFGNGSSGKLSTKDQETFVCNVFNALAEGIRDGQNTDLDSLSEATKFVNGTTFDRLVKILDILNIDNVDINNKAETVTSEDPKVKELINAIKSGWDISFFKTCELIFRILKTKNVDIKDYKLIRFDDTIRNGDSLICKKYLELVNTIAKPLGLERNNVTTADALLYNNSQEAVITMDNILKKIKKFYTTNKSDGKDNINDNVDKQKMTADDAITEHSQIVSMLSDLWKKHNIIGISLKKTDENAKAYRCNFSDKDNIRTYIDVSNILFKPAKENATGVGTITCDAEIKTDSIDVEGQIKDCKVQHSLLDIIKESANGGDEEVLHDIKLGDNIKITIRSFGEKTPIGADITLSNQPTLGKVSSETFRHFCSTVTGQNKEMFKGYNNKDEIRDLLRSKLNDKSVLSKLDAEVVKLIESGIKVNNFALPFILIK
nr:MAG TPA: hypothetical protein [Caudoviricetes sp.]